MRSIRIIRPRCMEAAMNALFVEIDGQRMEKLANAVGSTEKKVDGLCKDVEAIKAKPGKRWEALAMDVMKVIVGGLMGFLLVKLGIG